MSMSKSIFLFPSLPFMRPAVLHKKGRLSTTPILLSASAVTTGTNLFHQFVSKVASNFWNRSPPPSLSVFVCHCLASKSFPLNSWLCPCETSTCRVIPPPPLWAERMTPRDKNTSLWIFTSIQVSKCSLLIIVILYIWFSLPQMMF